MLLEITMISYIQIDQTLKFTATLFTEAVKHDISMVWSVIQKLVFNSREELPLENYFPIGAL